MYRFSQPRPPVHARCPQLYTQAKVALGSMVHEVHYMAPNATSGVQMQVMQDR
jgi:hypothetical protein